MKRKINPEDILLPPGYRIDVFATVFTTPINIMFIDTGEMLAANLGVTSGSGKVLIHTLEGFRVIAEVFNPPLTGINYFQGNIL